mmetsp:Transcript_129425/g.360501  ORF Transcript_129425/g.360501 Transcript_129425/m.360501 type:complete len:255 (+) Transcript_129425:1124-1888(+)
MVICQHEDCDVKAPGRALQDLHKQVKANVARAGIHESGRELAPPSPLDAPEKVQWAASWAARGFEGRGTWRAQGELVEQEHLGLLVHRVRRHDVLEGPPLRVGDPGAIHGGPPEHLSRVQADGTIPRMRLRQTEQLLLLSYLTNLAAFAASLATDVAAWSMVLPVEPGSQKGQGICAHSVALHDAFKRPPLGGCHPRAILGGLPQLLHFREAEGPNLGKFFRPQEQLCLVLHPANLYVILVPPRHVCPWDATCS